MFDSLWVTVSRGEFISETRVTAQRFNVKMCGGARNDDVSATPADGTTTRVDVRGAVIGNVLSVCSTGGVALDNVRSSSATAQYDVSAGHDAAITFEGLFGGTVDLASGATGSVDFRNADCTRAGELYVPSSTTYEGKCGLPGNNHLKARAGGNVVLAFVGTAATLPPASSPGVPVPKPEVVPLKYPPPSSDNVVRRGAEWLFTTSDTPLDAEWTSIAFDDQQWQRGDAPFGYGDDDRGAQYGYALTPKVSNLYLRHSFSISAAELAFSGKRRLLVRNKNI